jgi:regulation of enolase protein 1 (concanavalin A-like superfamily)
MTELLLYEAFDGTKLNKQLEWFNPPRKWTINSSQPSLAIETFAETDFWQKTHYDFEIDNGHFLFTELEDNFNMSTKVSFYPVHQYDQAGLMIYISPNCWLKTSVEYEPNEESRLGVVVTNNGYSDWSTQNFPDDCNEISLRIKRQGCDYIVEYQQMDKYDWIQIRIAHLHDDKKAGAVKCGLYACSPKGEGYKAEFAYLKIEK